MRKSVCLLLSAQFVWLYQSWHKGGRKVAKIRSQRWRREGRGQGPQVFYADCGANRGHVMIRDYVAVFGNSKLFVTSSPMATPFVPLLAGKYVNSVTSKNMGSKKNTHVMLKTNS